MTMMMMMILCPKAGSLGFTPPGDEMSEVVSRCLPHRQLWVSNLSKVATRWHEVDSNPRPFGCKAQNIPLHHGIPLNNNNDNYLYGGHTAARKPHKQLNEVSLGKRVSFKLHFESTTSPLSQPNE